MILGMKIRTLTWNSETDSGISSIKEVSYSSLFGGGHLDSQVIQSGETLRKGFGSNAGLHELNRVKIERALWMSKASPEHMLICIGPQFPRLMALLIVLLRPLSMS